MASVSAAAVAASPPGHVSPPAPGSPTSSSAPTAASSGAVSSPDSSPATGLNLTTSSKQQSQTETVTTASSSSNNNSSIGNTSSNNSTPVSGKESSSSLSPPATSPSSPPPANTQPVSAALSSSSSFSSTSSATAATTTATSTSTRPLRLRRVNHSDEIVSGFGKLLKSESMTDVTLSCQGGLNIRAHRVILSTFSPYFRAIFESQPFVDTPWTYPVVVMKDYGYLEVKAIIEFIYRGEVSVPRDRLAAVLATARALEVSGLADLKAENFGVGPVASAVATGNGAGTCGATGEESSNSSSPPGLVNGNSFPASNLSGVGSAPVSLTSAAACGSGLKRSLGLGSVSSASDLDPNSLYGHHSDTLSSVMMAKKLRGCLDNNEINSSAAALSSLAADDSHASLTSGLNLSNLSALDGVRSLLQQPPRLPASVLNQLVQQQMRQQQLQQLAAVSLQNQRSSPSAGQLASSPIPRNVSLQQMMQHHQQQQQQQQKVVSTPHLNQTSARLNPRHLQLQSHNLKQQILQQQLLRSKNLQSNSSTSGSNNFVRQGSVHPFAQFQQRIRQQIQEKQRNQLQNRHLLPKGFKDRVKLDNIVAGSGGKNDSHHEEEDEEEVEVMIKEGESGEKENGNSGSRNEMDDEENENDEDSSDNRMVGNRVKKEDGGESIDNEESQLVVREDDESNQNQNEEEEEMEQEDEEYEIEIDKDAIFQQQQQLRLQQIQKQQHQYQLQLQMEQDEQEQRLLDYHQSLSQTANNSEYNENDDNGSGYGFDWQEGFTDDLPYAGQKLGDTASLMKSHLQSASINSNTNGNKNATPISTPDFLQPRGPGRPRKGNKAQEISPCPECNKVFVRPDVLKLHYRSVHLNERHPCNLCPKIFKWPGDLSKHKRTKHPDKHPPANQNTGLHVQ